MAPALHEPPDAGTAAAEWLVEHRDELVRLAYRFCWRIEDAEDVVQETFIQVQQHGRDLRDAGSAAAWVRRVAVQQALLVVRRRRRWHDQLLRIWQRRADPRSSSDGDDLAESLKHWIRELPPKRQTAFVLREIEGWEYEAIGELMQTTPATVRVHVAQARETLRRRVTRAGGAA